MSFLRTTAVVGVGALILAGAMASATSAQVAVAISGEPYELKSADDGRTLSIDVVNAGAAPIDVRLEPAKRRSSCLITADHERIAGNRTKTVKFTVPDSCGFTEDPKESVALEFIATTEDGDEALETEISATPAKEGSRDFRALLFYIAGLVVAFIVVGSIYEVWRKDYTEENSSFTAGLPGIKDDWSFKDSWGSNVGLAATIFTGVLGASNILETILGDDTDETVALALVSAAMSAAFIGAAPLLLLALRVAPMDSTTTPKLETVHSVRGVLAGTLIVLGANLGQIAVMAFAVADADVVDWYVAASLAVVAWLLVVFYAVRSVPQTLIAGAIPPTPVTPDGKLISAAILEVAGRLPPQPDKSYPNVDVLAGLVTSPGDDEGYRPSAMF